MQYTDLNTLVSCRNKFMFLQHVISSPDPFLNTGIDFETFKPLGNFPSRNDSLIKWDNGTQGRSPTIFVIFPLFQNPLNFWKLFFWLIIITSAGVVGVRNKDLHWECQLFYPNLFFNIFFFLIHVSLTISTEFIIVMFCDMFFA